MIYIQINIMLMDGCVRVNHFNFEAFNEGRIVESIIESYYEFYGYYPEYFLGDKIYLNRVNKKYLKEKNVKIAGKPLGRPPKQNNKRTSERRKKEKKPLKGIKLKTNPDRQKEDTNSIISKQD